MIENLSPQHRIFTGQSIGIGTWSWGDRLYWGYGLDYGDDDLEAAFLESLENGITFFDTAENYGQGKSEELLGKFIQKYQANVTVASKVLPFPWRFNHTAFLAALRASIQRLNLEQIDLYQIHFPIPPVRIEFWMESMADALEQKLISAIGVCNFNLSQMMKSYEILARHGIRLASNQVEYSLLNRSIERNGLLSRCHELGVTLVAYSPLGLGLLTGKYGEDKPLKGFRSIRMSHVNQGNLQNLITLLKKIGAEHGGKTPAQVALNWAICKGTLPLAGVKTKAQAAQNSGAVGWDLSEEEVQLLDTASRVSLWQQRKEDENSATFG